jgi:hypothetical protein
VRGIAQRATECAVDGIAVTGSVGVLRSSPEAALGFAGGYGLDGGDPDRSTIDHAVARASDSAERRRPMAASATSRIYTSLTDATQLQPAAMAA